MSEDFISEYHSPGEEDLKNICKLEFLAKQYELEIRTSCSPGLYQEQALFRLKESLIWATEAVKDKEAGYGQV